MAVDKKFGLLVELKSDIKKFQQGMGKAQGGVQKMVSSLKAMGVAMLAAFSVKAIGSFIKSISRLYNIQAKAEALLLTALKGRQDIQGRLMKQASELQKITLFGDEETIAAQAMLASMSLNEEAITRLIPLVQDLATAKGMDLRGAADLVAKSVGSSTNAMSRYGIEITGAVGSSERLNTACENLSKAFEGQSEAAAAAGTGGITQLKNALDDIKELMGEVVIETTNVDEAAGELAETLSEIDWDKTFKPWRDFKNTLRDLWPYIEGLTGMLGKFVKAKNIILELLPKKGVEGEAEVPYYGTERTGIKAGELPAVPGLPFMGPGAMTLEDMQELHAAYVKNQELLAAQAGYMNDMAVSTHEATEAIKWFIPAMEEEANVLDGTEEVIKAYNESLKEAAEWTSVMNDIITSSVDALADSLLQGAANFKEYGKSLGSTAKQIIGVLLAESIAHLINRAIKDASKIPFVGLVLAPILAGVAAGIVKTAFNSLIPDFAAGAIVSGETIARVGEYPGARSNPEVIAPLNKLQSMLDGGGEVVFVIKGDTLEGVRRNYYQRRQLMR